MPFADLPGIRIHYLDLQAQEKADLITEIPIVFVHGFTMDHRSWHPQAEFFRKNFRVIIPDSRGHGLSEAPITGYSRDDRAQDLQKLFDHLQIDKVHLVGLSMGGTTAIGFALKYQDRLKSLTLIDSGAAGYAPIGRISRIDQIAREKGLEPARKKWIQIATMWYREDKREIKELIQLMMREHSGAIWMDEMRGKYPRTIDLDNVHKIKVPTRIMVGELDKMFIPVAVDLQAAIPNSSLSIYEGVGHMLNLEVPERLNQELKVFVEGISRDAIDS